MSSNSVDYSFTLTPEQRRFKALLDGYPYLHPYWDFASGSCRVEALQESMRVLSHGERILGQFFLELWDGTDAFGFDMFEAAQTLDQKDVAILAQWLQEPFWP